MLKIGCLLNEERFSIMNEVAFVSVKVNGSNKLAKRIINVNGFSKV